MALIILTPSIAQGVEVEGLYRASVQVSSRDDESERQQAFASGMREVLLKVSGNTEVLNINSIRRALNNPGDYVETWGYRAIQLDEDDEEIEVTTEILIAIENESAEPVLPIESESLEIIELEISFFESEILTLLDDNNLSFWPSNRPATLLWVVVQDELGEREMLGSGNDTADEIVNMIALEGERRALPLLLPLMDLEDQQALNADELWSLNEELISVASSRYQTESILVLRMYRSLSGELVGKSLYLFREGVLSLDSFEESQAEFIERALSLATGELSAYYAIRISGGGGNVIVDLTVEGVNSTHAYAELLNYVGALTDVNSYQVESVDQQSLVLKLSTGGQLRQLVETIALDQNLELMAELDRDAQGVHMYYRWVD